MTGEQVCSCKTEICIENIKRSCDTYVPICIPCVMLKSQNQKRSVHSKVQDILLTHHFTTTEIENGSWYIRIIIPYNYLGAPVTHLGRRGHAELEVVVSSFAVENKISI